MSLPQAIDIMMRGGDNPNLNLNGLERQISMNALTRFNSNPVFMQKGPKWTYNWTHFNTLWMTKNQTLIDLLYEYAPYPEYIEVETTTYCNLKCKICEHTYWDEPNVHMTFEQFKHIVDQFPTLKWIGMTGIGEAWTNPDFEQMLRYIKARGTYVELYDSFYFTDDYKARLQVELGVEKVFVSLDAASKETYEKIRVGSDFDRVIENVKRVDKWKKKLNKYFPELCFHFIVTKDNIHEVIDYLHMVRNLGIDAHFIQFTRMLHNFPEAEEQFVEIPDELIQEVTEEARKLGIQIGWNATVPTVKPAISECTAWWMPFFFVDGTTIPCCALNEGNHREWQRSTSLGNIFEQSFREIWWNTAYTNMRTVLSEGECPVNCSRCPIYEVRS